MRHIHTIVLLSIATFAIVSCKKEQVASKSNEAAKVNKLTINASDTCSSAEILWDITTVNTNSSNVAQGISITVDKYDNIYIAGVYRGTVDIDPGPGVFNLTGKGAYVQKLDANGKFKGARQVPLNYEDYYIPLLYYQKGFTDIDVDAAGNVILTTCANEIANVYKADRNGNQIFKLNLRSVNASDFRMIDAAQTAVDSQGNLIIAGSYGGEQFDLDPGPAVYNTPATGHGIYVLKVDAAGKFLAAKFYTALTDVYDLKIDKADNIYATGFAYETDIGVYYRFIKADNNGNVLINKVKSSHLRYTPVSFDKAGNIFLGIEYVPKKYSPAGNLVWSTNFTYEEMAFWIHAFGSDNTGNLYVATGAWEGNEQSLLIKFNEQGQELYRENIPGNTDQEMYPMLIAPDSQNNIILSISSGAPGGNRIIKYKACQ